MLRHPGPPPARSPAAGVLLQIAIYPDDVWLAARILQAASASYRTAV